MDYLLAAHIQVTGGAEAASQINQVVTQINNFGAATKQANTGAMASDMDKAAQSSSTLSQALSRVGDAVIRMATYQGIRALEDGFRTAKDAVLDFDQSMTESLAIQTGVTSGMRSQMENMAESIAIKFGEAPNKVADGFYFMASAGLTAQQQIATLPGVMAFAKAGMMDLDQATEMLFDSLSAIGQKSADPQVLAQNLGHLSDVLTEAAIKSQATVEQMGAALSNKAGASIKAFNLDLNESVGVLEVFADQGIKGTTAGERFSMLIRDMALKSQKFGDEWKAMGVQVFDSQGNFNSLVTIFQQLDAALLPMSGEQRINALKSMGFTLRDISTVMSVLGTSGNLASFVADLDNAGGVAQRVAENQMESLRAKLNQLSAAFKVGAIEGFEKLVEFGNWLADTFAPAMNAAGPIFSRLGSDISILGGEFIRLGAAVGRVALEGIAAGIQKVGQFAADNQGATEAFALALASLAGIKAAESLAVLGASIGQNLTGKLSAATVSLQVIGSEMADVIRAGGGMTQALSVGFSGVMELVNPITLAVAGVAVALGVVWKQHADNVREAKAAVEELVQAIAQDLGVSVDEAAGALAQLRSEVDGGAQSFGRMAEAAQRAMADAVSHRVVTEGLADAFGRLGVTANDVGAALSTGTNFFEGWTQDTHTIAEMRAQLDQLPASVRPVAEALLNAYASGKISGPEFFNLARSFDFVADSADHVTQKFQDFAREALGTALANGEIDSNFLHFFGILDIGTASADQLLAAMNRLQQIQAPVDPMWADVDAAFLTPVAKGIDDVGSAADSAEQQVKDFSDALKDLQGGATKMGDLAHISQGMNDLWEAAHKYVDEKGSLADAFTSHTKEANALQSQLADTAKAHIDFAGSLADEGKFTEAKQYLIDYRTELYNMLEGLGLSREQILPLLESLGLTDAAIQGLDGKKADVEVTDNGTADATKAKLDGTADPRTANIAATPTNIDPANVDLAAVADAERVADIYAQPTNVEPTDNALNTAARKRESEAHQYGTNWPTVDSVFNQSARDRNSNANQTHTGEGGTEGAFSGSARDRNSNANQSASGWSGVDALFNYAARDRISTVTLNYTTTGTVYAGPNGTGIAEGDVIHAYASGGFENHTAQIGRAGRTGVTRMWNEPETGGEAYIPLAMAKRDRSLAIWEETGKLLGARSSTHNVSVSAPISVNISGAGDPDATGRAVAAQVESGINHAFRRLLVEMKS